jgi:hypothetical protein
MNRVQRAQFTGDRVRTGERGDRMLAKCPIRVTGPSRRRWHDDRCTSDSRRLAARPKSAESGQQETSSRNLIGLSQDLRRLQTDVRNACSCSTAFLQQSSIRLGQSIRAQSVSPRAAARVWEPRLRWRQAAAPAWAQRRRLAVAKAAKAPSSYNG